MKHDSSLPLGDVKGLLVRDFLETSAARDPDKVALITDGDRLTFRQLDIAADRLAHGLCRVGVEPGDRVMVVLPNSTAGIVAIFATLKASAVFAVVNETVKARKLIHLLKDSGAKALVTDRHRAARLREHLGEQSDLALLVVDGDGEAGTLSSTHSFWKLTAAGEPTRPPRLSHPEDLACLIYTSGSTGDSKGVMCGHDNVAFVSWSILTYLENTPDDVIINGLPFSFDYGLYQLLMSVRIGGTLVLQPFAFPAAVLRAIESERVTGLPGVPTFFSMMLQLDLERFDLRSLRYVTNTAAALPPSHITALREALPGVTVYSMYGLTECKRALYLPPAELDERPGSVGVPIPGTEAWLIDDDGNRLSAGSEGQLVVRGSHVMRGYWRDPDLTARTFRYRAPGGEGTLFTGDMMRSDEAGRFYFLARTDDIIKSRGEKVAPKEIENVLYQIPGIVKAAVVGKPDPVLGESIKAYVVSGREDLTAAEILRQCKRELEHFMIPSTVEFRRDLAVTPSGKIDKKDL